MWSDVSSLSLTHLQSVDHIDPSNCASVLAAASLLDVLREQRGVELTVHQEQRVNLVRLESEVREIESGDHEQFPVPVEDLKRILQLLVSL